MKQRGDERESVVVVVVGSPLTMSEELPMNRQIIILFIIFPVAIFPACKRRGEMGTGARLEPDHSLALPRRCQSRFEL